MDQLYCYKKFLIEDNNRKKGTEYDVNKLDFKLNMNGITDDMETVNMITASKGIVSEKTLLAQHPFVQDVNSEMEVIKQEKERNEKYDADGENGQAGTVQNKRTRVSAENSTVKKGKRRIEKELQ